MTDLTCISNYVSVTKDIVLTIAGGIGAYVALKGLNTWNRQLKGGVEYELTRRLLKLTYRLRDAIRNVRNPAMFGGEMPYPSSDEAKEMSRDQINYYGMSKAYQNRWDKVTQVSSDLQAELLEAEALWGADVHKQFEHLFKLRHELWMAVHFHLMAINPEQQNVTREAMNRILKREILYDLSGENEDEFSSEIAKAITPIETFLKPYLKK